MRNCWRILLLCLTMLALPLQGVAAVRMLHCLTTASAAQSTAWPTGHVADETAHHHAAHESHDHAHAHVHPHGHDGSPAGEADDGAAADTAHGHGASHKCSACAACCAGMAVAFELPLMPQPPHGAEHTPVAEAAAASFIAGGLERPPRSTLA